MPSQDDDERAPLLPQDDYRQDDVHDQFCQLIGVPPSDLPAGKQWPIPKHSLYERVIGQRRRQNLTYQLTATTSNFLLLAQVVIGAALTGLGASNSPHIIITILGASNTIIAGLVAYLKSRGQPMRARMFRDDLERVVDEIENSEVMWLGISKDVNGYDAIDTDDKVTVRSEVARLTRLYDKAVRNNTANNPDLYGQSDGTTMNQTALRNRPVPSTATQQPLSTPTGPAAGPAPVPADASGTPAAAPEPVAADPDDSPATAKPTDSTAVKVVVVDSIAKTGATKLDEPATRDDTNDPNTDKGKAATGQPKICSKDTGAGSPGWKGDPDVPKDSRDYKSNGLSTPKENESD